MLQAGSDGVVHGPGGEEGVRAEETEEQGAGETLTTWPPGPPGPLATWPPGHLATYGHMTNWPPYHMTNWPPSHLAIWPPGLLATWPPGHLAPWPPGCGKGRRRRRKYGSTCRGARRSSSAADTSETRLLVVCHLSGQRLCALRLINLELKKLKFNCAYISC